MIAYVGHGDAPLLADRSDQAAIILKVELSAPSDASISSASKMKPGAIGARYTEFAFEQALDRGAGQGRRNGVDVLALRYCPAQIGARIPPRRPARPSGCP